VKNILDGNLNGTAADYKPKGKAQIILKHISSDYHPLGKHNVSSVTFIACKAHENEQNKFVGNLRDGCSNLVKHTKNEPDSACPMLFVRLCASASVKNCSDWAEEYFKDHPNDRVGLILLYQEAVVISTESTSLTHYILPILGPQFAKWANPSGLPARTLPNMGVLVGNRLDEAARKVIIADDGRQFELDGRYSYQRGDIYRFYRMEGGGVPVKFSNPAPGIKVHAEIEENGQFSVRKRIASHGELHLLT
jgi:hypothetical protein